MENKYYIPTIEEFHVGFELETNDCSVLPIEEQKWSSHILNAVTIISLFYDLNFTGKEPERTARNNSVRVKYLDREDVENLGWTITKNREDEFDAQLVISEKQFFDITYDSFLKELSVELFYQGSLVGKTLDKNTFNSTTVFKGTIKNKSEFHRLINQLKPQN